jgi:hypothetical protein
MKHSRLTCRLPILGGHARLPRRDSNRAQVVVERGGRMTTPTDVGFDNRYRRGTKHTVLNPSATKRHWTWKRLVREAGLGTFAR